MPVCVAGSTSSELFNHRAFWDREVVCRVALYVRVEAKDRQSLGSEIWCGGSRLGVRH